MAALARPGGALRTKGRLRPIRPARDLADVADLTELGFGDRLGHGGKEVIREMRQLASLGPLLWPLSWALRLSMGAGFVWEEDGKVVGNISLFDAGRFPTIGRGWLIANVVVHPAYRRHGIARALVGATLENIRRRGGRWCALQVERDNGAARALYESLGFRDRGLLLRWEAAIIGRERWKELYNSQPRARHPRDAAQEVAIVLQSRPAMIIWSRVLALGELRGDWLWGLGKALGGLGSERWVIDDPDHSDAALLGAAWIEGLELRRHRVSLFYDFPLRHPEERRALAAFALHRATANRIGGRLEVEHAGEDPAIEELLYQEGFRLHRELVQMWHPLESI